MKINKILTYFLAGTLLVSGCKSNNNGSYNSINGDLNLSSESMTNSSMSSLSYEEQRWLELEGTYYGQELKVITDTIIVDATEKTITVNDVSGKLYGKANETYVFDCEFKSKGMNEYDIYIEYDYFLILNPIPSYESVFYILEDGRINCRGWYLNKVKYTEESISKLIYPFPFEESNNIDGELVTAISFVYYIYGYEYLASMMIYDCSWSWVNLEMTEEIKVDVKLSFEVYDMNSSDIAAFNIVAVTADYEVVLDKWLVYEEADIGDKIRVEATFFFDYDDVDNGIIIMSDSLNYGEN